MSVAAAVGAIKTAIETFNKLREITKSIKDAEVKSTIAQLSNDLADAQMKMADLKMELITLKEENLALKARPSKEKYETQWGCYVFEGDPELYCPGCYATKGVKAPTTRLDSRYRQCTVCRVKLG